MKNTLRGLLVALLLALGLTACGSSQPAAYYPTAYGANGYCYYVSSPYEVLQLQQAGLCPRTWHPLLMPGYWHNQYFAYYDSPRYYNSYVPVAQRTVYVQQQHTYYVTNKNTVVNAEESANWKTAKGKVVSGAKAGVAKIKDVGGTKVQSTSKVKTNTGSGGSTKINLQKPAAPRPAAPRPAAPRPAGKK